MLRDNVIVYDDGTPRTKHVTTNIAIEVDEEAGTAVAPFVLHRATSLARPCSAAHRQRQLPRPLRAPDGEWRFVERRVRTDLVGDVSRHLRRSAGQR